MHEGSAAAGSKVWRAVRLAAVVMIGFSPAAVAGDALAAEPAPPAIATSGLTAEQSLHEAARAALAQVRQRLEGHAWSVENDATMRALLASSAVRVTLRSGGRSVGAVGAEGWVGVQAATEDALRAMAVQLGSGRAGEGGGGVGGGGAAGMVQSEGDVLDPARTTVAIELAGPAGVVGAERFADLDQRLPAGREALRVTLADAGAGEPRRAWIFPSQQRWTNDSPARAVLSAVATLSGDPAGAVPGVAGRELGDWTRGRGLEVATAPVAHVAELTPRGTAVVLTRGSVLMPQSAVTRATLLAQRDDIVTHLAGRVQQLPTGPALSATFWSLQGRHEGRATPLQASLTAYAVARTGTPQGVALARQLLGDVLLGGAARAPELSTPATAAAALLALDELLTRTDEADTPRWASDALPGLGVTLRQSFDVSRNRWSDGVPAPARGLVCHALARLATSDTLRAWGLFDAGDESRARAAVRQVFAEAGPAGQLVAQMPWLGWAELTLAQAGASKAGEALSNVPAAGALRDLSEQVLARQVGTELASIEGEDAMGAILLSAGDGLVLPSWQSARPMALLATMVRIEALVAEAEAPRRLARVLDGMRFLQQLTADDGWVGASSEPRLAFGGVRNALFDQRQSLEASAMTLLAIEQTVASIDALAQRAAGAGAPARPGVENR